MNIDGTNGVLRTYDYQTPVTGFTYTVPSGYQVAILNPAGTLATGTVTLPASVVDGMTVTISSTQTITALTLSGSGSQTVSNPITTISAGTAVSYLYKLSTTTWYRVG